MTLHHRHFGLFPVYGHSQSLFDLLRVKYADT